MKYFSINELMCPCCNHSRLNVNFQDKLVELRGYMKVAFIVNSCCRCEAHNIIVGGHPKSLHLMHNPYHNSGGTMAIDISTKGMDAATRMKLFCKAFEDGWSVGIAKTFVHLDRRIDIGLEQVQYVY